jgi:hypothetical protein
VRPSRALPRALSATGGVKPAARAPRHKVGRIVVLIGAHGLPRSDTGDPLQQAAPIVHLYPVSRTADDSIHYKATLVVDHRAGLNREHRTGLRRLPREAGLGILQRTVRLGSGE